MSTKASAPDCARCGSPSPRGFLCEVCLVAKIIQEDFFPYPPTRWETMAPHQKREFLDCADEILTSLKERKWKP